MLKLFKTNLSLFDGGAAAGGVGGATAGGDGGTSGDGTLSAAAEQNTGEAVTGTQEVVEAEPQKTLKERTKEYRDLINGQYKDIHTAETQKIFDRRFRDHKVLEKQVSDQGAIIDRLMDRYGISDGNLRALSDAIDDDDSLWENAADEAGMSVSQYKEFQKLTRQNQQLLNAEREREREAQVNATVARWNAEAEQLRQEYPDFNLDAEIANPEFGRLLQSGIPVATAYQVCHLAEIQKGVAAYAVEQTEKKVIDSVRAKGKRPVENGSSNQSAFVTKTDVHKLTRAERAELARRAARGEVITLN